ncbi:tyrosine-type recombinase/integrase [Longispora albida]|uniref:tyrosine-type recombinase/integrase n=1 Tax=Longispora albida TaxID=203523 RepID=UPI0003A5D13A|nr:tyrosine-type recombinase/integrase [Longispora albida]
MIYSIPVADAIEEYTSSSVFSRLSDSTQRQRRATLQRLQAAAAGLRTDDLRARHIDLCLQDIEQGDAHLGGRRTGKSQASLNSDRASLSMFLEWARDRAYVLPTLTATAELKYARKAVANTLHRVPAERLPEMLEAAGQRHPVERMAAALGIYLGCRPGEAVLLRIESVDFAAMEIELVSPKTQKRERKPICAELLEELVTYFGWYRQMSGRTRLVAGWYLLPARLPSGSPGMPRGLRNAPGVMRMVPQWPVDPEKPLRRQTIERSIKFVLKALGWEPGGLKQVGGHTLRRSAAKALYERLRDSGTDDALVMVQTLLGHANISTTMAYIGVDTHRDKLRALLQGRRMYAEPEPAAPAAGVVELESRRRGKRSAAA